jgi:DNA-binding NarL/FixJ family response regulator
MTTEVISGEPVVVVVDAMELRRALVSHFLKDWAAVQKLQLLSFTPKEACTALRGGSGWRMIIFNVGSYPIGKTLDDIRELRAQGQSASLVVLADEEVPEDVIATIQTGAVAYLSNRSPPDLALQALSLVLQGGTYYPRTTFSQAPFGDDKRAVELRCLDNDLLLEGGADNDKRSPSSELRSFSMAELSERQKAILEGLYRGEPDKTIGRSLNLPVSTVKVHVREIMRKLSVSNRTQAAVAAARMRAQAIGSRH